MENLWPELEWGQWSATAETLHMWMQIVGKTRLALCPLQAQWWNVPLYVSARGLSTAAMPYGDEFLEIEFDFVSHELRFRLSEGRVRRRRCARRAWRRFMRSISARCAGWA